MSSSQPDQRYDVLVVGAGMSGLAAAASCAQAGLRVLVLEARDRQGGRIHTYSSSRMGSPIDLGASFIHGIEGNPLFAIANKLKLRLLHPERDTMAHGAVYVEGKPLPEDRSQQLQMNLFNGFFDAARQYAQQEASPSHTETLQDYLLDSNRSPLYDQLSAQDKEYAARLARGFSGWPGADIDQISLRHWGFEREYEGEDVLMQDGYQTVISAFDKLLRQHDGQVKLNEEVGSITHLAQSESVEVKTKSGSTYQASACICTLPLGVLKAGSVSFDPPLSARRQHAIDHLGFGLLNKLVISYPEVWWTHDKAAFGSILPENGLTDQVPSVKTGALSMHPYVEMTDGKPTLMLYLGGSMGEEVERLSDEEAQEWAHNILAASLTKLDSVTKVPQPTEVQVTRWRSDKFSMGSYLYLPPTAEASPLDMIELSKPLWDGRLGFAGEATEVDCYASVHGALLSGYRDALRVGAMLDKPVRSLEHIISCLA